jgi:hypothetical protein
VRHRRSSRLRNYWTYSAAVLIVWLAILGIVSIVSPHAKLHNFELLFGGWAIGWVSTTIARYVYPPPKRWFQNK